ncbi:MAG: peptide chain release factor N(5)-glutamine methyltransferase [Prevotella sp.]|nr:peptide chain release factor N(5)-glutamine methyltransferase [Prevotella sp.]MCM1075001.1 peptide chain release factor N(5)-glutamine methyltransferase [Ruminococcus sp.]
MKETIKHLRAELSEIYPRGEAEAIIRLIFEHLKGWKPVDIVLNEDKPLSEFMRGKVDAILTRLKRHEPIQYIIGEARFYGLNFKVDRNVLVPRPETEELVEMIVRDAAERSDLRVLDAGTGSGCIAIALARNLRFPRIMAIDISDAALKIAAENAETLKCNISFIKEDMLNLPPDNDCWDILVSNPPYIAQSEAAEMDANVLDYEPRSALFVPDNDPLKFYKALARYGREALTSGGRIYFEINPLYADNLKAQMTREDYKNIELHRDIHGKNRFLSATK